MTVIRGEAAVTAERLVELETVIDRGRKSFIDVGNALAEIRDSRLYRETHATFEEYCKERWGFGRRHSNQLIAAANIVEEMGTTVPMPLPTSERQVRELARIDDAEVRTAVWEKVVETDGENATAKVVKLVVDTVIEAMPVPVAVRREGREAVHVAAVLANLPVGPQQAVLDTRAWVSSCLAKGREVIAIVPEEVVPMLDETHQFQMRAFIADIRAWTLEVEAAMHVPLHAVGG